MITNQIDVDFGMSQWTSAAVAGNHTLGALLGRHFSDQVYGVVLVDIPCRVLEAHVPVIGEDLKMNVFGKLCLETEDSCWNFLSCVVITRFNESSHLTRVSFHLQVMLGFCVVHTGRLTRGRSTPNRLQGLEFSKNSATRHCCFVVVVVVAVASITLLIGYVLGGAIVDIKI